MRVIPICMLLAVTVPAAADLPAEEQALWDHYVGKMVTAKIDLPYFVVINNGELDTIDYRRALNPEDHGGAVLGGIALAKGQSNVIASVTVKKKYVRFNLGETGKKQWLDAFTKPLPTEAPGRDDAPTPVTITLMYDAEIGRRGAKFGTAREIAPGDLNIASINRQLTAIIDTRTLMSLEDVPAELRAAVEAGRAEVGMDKKTLFLSMGEPDQRKTDLEGDDVVERWVYESDEMETTVVVMTNGRVTAVKRF